MKETSMQQSGPKPRNRALVGKILFVTVILLLCLQYLVNMIVYNRNHSTILTVINYAFENNNNSADILRQFMTTRTTTTEWPLEICPVIPPHINGRVSVNLEIPAWAYVEEQNQMVSPGGRYKPEDCIARNKVAIIIPYRDREIHLKLFLQNIHPFLRSQQLDYAVFVVELAPNIRFNRAALMNIGFLEASKLYDYECFIFHDVDLLPEDDRNLYVCPSMPRHMSAAIDKLHYKLPYPQIFGGVSAIRKDHFVQINGFSNLYFGWGGEDDDMYKRILYSNLTITRYSTEVARYKMLSHVKDKGNPQRYKNLRTTRARRLVDGINSLKYTRLKLEFRPLYTWVYVSLNETEILNNRAVVERIKAAQAILAAQKAKQNSAKANQNPAKAKQNKKHAQRNKAQKKKQAQKKHAQNETQPHPPSAQKQEVEGDQNAQKQEQASDNSVQNQTVLEKAVQYSKAALATAIQKQKAVLEKVKQIRKASQMKAGQNRKPANQRKKPDKTEAGVKQAFMKKPQLVSWVPTNASVPANLTIDEHL